jgi:hypothetical protein
LTQIKAEIGDKKTEAHEIILNLRDRIEDFLTVGPATPEKHLSLLFSAVAALMVFVQSNWTGPGLENADPTPVRYAGDYGHLWDIWNHEAIYIHLRLEHLSPSYYQSEIAIKSLNLENSSLVALTDILCTSFACYE